MDKNALSEMSLVQGVSGYLGHNLIVERNQQLYSVLQYVYLHNMFNQDRLFHAPCPFHAGNIDCWIIRYVGLGVENYKFYIRRQKSPMDDMTIIMTLNKSSWE